MRVRTEATRPTAPDLFLVTIRVFLDNFIERLSR